MDLHHLRPRWWTNSADPEREQDQRRSPTAGRVARGATSLVIGPLGEQIVNRIGYRRVAVWATVVLTARSLLVGSIIFAVLVTLPATAPVAAAGAVVSKFTDLFGAYGGDGNTEMSEQDLRALASQPAPPCPAQSRRTSSPSEHPSAATTTSPRTRSAAASSSSRSEGVAPMQVGPSGEISRADGKKLIDPIPPGISAVRVNVWLLYRLAGMGEWESFTRAYRAAGLDDKQVDRGVVERQIQAINHSGADVEKYRYTAAAIALAGVTRGRYPEPDRKFREVLSIELMSGCSGDPAVVSERPSLPPPSITSTAPPR